MDKMTGANGMFVIMTFLVAFLEPQKKTSKFEIFIAFQQF